jgi:hypothetical protein
MSSTLRPSTILPRILNKDSFTLSAVGRVSCPLGVLSLAPRALPVIIRIFRSIPAVPARVFPANLLAQETFYHIFSFS